MVDELRIDELFERARGYRMGSEEREVQRRSFAYGNVAIKNPDITRELIDSVADEINAGYNLD